MALTKDKSAEQRVRDPDGAQPGDRILGHPAVIVAAALALLLVLGWQLMLHPSWTAPTRDPAWYTWRANVVMHADPGSIARGWGPAGLFSGGYRVTVPLGGALLQRVAGIDQYTFSAFLMIGMPVLAGLALGAAGYRARRDPALVLLSMLAAAALFLTTPYVGYLDNITMLFLLCLTIPFVGPARTSWGARTALFLIGITAAFTHPTTCVLFGLSLMAVFGWHVLTSRFRFGPALKSDAPMLWSVGSGMVVGLAMWVVGIWGPSASLADAALPPPYTKGFFMNRLGEWVTSLHPEIIGPFILIAIVSTILLSRRTRERAGAYEMVSIWWLFPLLGTFSFLAGGVKPVPYYRFMNSSAAVIPLTALGAVIAIRWLLRRAGAVRVVGALLSVAIVGSLGFVLYDGLANRWVDQKRQWADEPARVALAAAHEVVAAAGARPNILLVNYGDTDDEFGTNVAYGWAKTFTNVFRTGLPGEDVKYAATYLGTLENLHWAIATPSDSEGYSKASADHAAEVRLRRSTYPKPPVVFLYKGFYQGNVDVEAAMAQGVEIGPDIVVLDQPGLWVPPAAVVERAQAAAAAERDALENHPGPLANPFHTLRVLVGLFFLIVLPGLVAAPFFELEDWPSRIALVPGMSIVLSLLSGIAVLAVWRGPLTTSKAWVVVAVATGTGAALRLGRERALRVLNSFGGFFNKLTEVFSNTDFAILVGVQFLVQAGQGVIQGAIGKSIAFGGEKGFDVSNVPSADYLLKVVLALYVPYTLISPFIGVFIDRFARRRVVWWSNLLTAVILAGVAVAVLIPLGSGTTEGNVGATAALVLALLAAQAVVRIMLAVKSAAMPDVLSGKDLLQGNGLSQAGGALFQVVGIAFGTAFAGLIGAWVGVLTGAIVLVIAAFVALRMHRVEAHAHETTFAQEASQVARNIVAGLKEVAGRPAAALGLSAFQMLRYQFWGFVLFTFALYGKNLVEGGDANTLSLVLSGLGGMVGGAIGLILAQKLKDRVAPIRLLLVSMALLGAGTLVFGAIVSVLGFAALLFIGFFAFFVGKISADTIMQQTMPDDFRGRAFALFDIAYNLGFIVPALTLSLIWVEGSDSRTRAILMVSGAVFLVLTTLVRRWATRIKDQFAPQDDLVETA